MQRANDLSSGRIPKRLRPTAEAQYVMDETKRALLDQAGIKSCISCPSFAGCLSDGEARLGGGAFERHSAICMDPTESRTTVSEVAMPFGPELLSQGVKLSGLEHVSTRDVGGTKIFTSGGETNAQGQKTDKYTHIVLDKETIEELNALKQNFGAELPDRASKTPVRVFGSVRPPHLRDEEKQDIAA